MKKSLFTLAACVLLILVGVPASFGQQKIGHIDTGEIMKLMPERDSAAKIYEKFNAEITKNYEEMNVNYNNMVETYNKQRDSLSEFIRNAKETEFRDMSAKIQNFRDVAQQELEKKQNELMAPILAKLKAAIKAVAETNKFTYILDTQGGVGTVVYIPDDESLNITPLVKAKLGIK